MSMIDLFVTPREVQQFMQWLKCARSGDQYVYYSGPSLACSKREVLASATYQCYRNGFVSLVQKRIDHTVPRAYNYIAIRTNKPN